MVAGDMLKNPEWFEKYGLNFTETMNLEYGQYFTLLNQLERFERNVKNETPAALEKIEKRLMG